MARSLGDRVRTFACTLVVAVAAHGVPPSADRPPGLAQPPITAASGFGLRTGVNFTISFADPTGPIAPYIPAIQDNLMAACNRWGSLLLASGNIEVLVQLGDVPRAAGASATSDFVYNNGTYDVFDQGMEGELRTGVDPNGTDPDVEITLGIDYLTNELWFDPSPNTRTAMVPSDRTDAVSVFIHEMCHALAFNGWRDSDTYLLPGNYESTFDEQEVIVGNDLFFEGTNAMQVYGGPVPITYGDANHLGNEAPRPGMDLIPDLMNGIVYYRGYRYDISPLDRAIIADTGVRITLACPADFNGSGTVTVQDIFDFLGAWFAHSPSADFNHSGAVTVQDIFDFLAAWFAGCH